MITIHIKLFLAQNKLKYLKKTLLLWAICFSRSDEND